MTSGAGADATAGTPTKEGTAGLRWTGERLQFVGRTTYGEAILVGGDADGPGAKPSDLLPLSLAACTAYDVVEILRKGRQPLRGMDVLVTWVQDRDPPWTFRSIHCRFVLFGAIDPSKADRAIDLAEGKYCAVAATLRSTVVLTHDADIRRDEEQASPLTDGGFERLRLGE